MCDLWTQYALDFLLVDLLFAHWLALLFLFAPTPPFILPSVTVRMYCPHWLKSPGRVKSRWCEFLSLMRMGSHRAAPTSMEIVATLIAAMAC